MTIVIYCEGETEQRVLPFLLNYFQARRRADEAQARLSARSLNGVSAYLTKIGPAVRNRIDVEGDQVVFGLIDFYRCGLHFVRPKAQDTDTLARRVEHLESQIHELIPTGCRRHFHQHFAVHEIEAWILSDEEPLHKRLGDSQLGPWPRPEEVNLNKSPSTQIMELYWNKRRESYQKTTDGENLLRKANPDRIYEKCPYFREFVDEVLEACKIDTASRKRRGRRQR